MDTWMTLRFLLYPVLLVAGLAWAVLFWRLRRRGAFLSLAAALGAAVAIQGGAGFMALLVSPAPTSVTGAIFTLGILSVTLVTAGGVAVMLREAWT